MARAADGRRARSERTADAREAEETFAGALDARMASLGGRQRIKAPPHRERVQQRWGGGTRDRSRGSYDWFYELHPEEQKRIRKNWFTDSGGVSPDEVENAGLPMGEWLTLTRSVDAARSVRAGREMNRRRYGGSHPLEFLHKGRPEDHGRPGRGMVGPVGPAPLGEPVAGRPVFHRLPRPGASDPGDRARRRIELRAGTPGAAYLLEVQT
jgi:hypothetical protein